MCVPPRRAPGGWPPGLSAEIINAVYECLIHRVCQKDKMHSQRNQAFLRNPLARSGQKHYNNRCGAADAAVYEWFRHSYAGRGVLVTPRGCRIYYFRDHHIRFFPKLQEKIRKNQRGCPRRPVRRSKSQSRTVKGRSWQEKAASL